MRGYDHDPAVHQELIDLGNHIEAIEDKVDAALRRLGGISKAVTGIAACMACDKADEEKAKLLAAELAAISTEIEASVAANVPTKTA